MARRHGSKGQVKMDPTGGATTEVVGDINSWTLDLARDKEDVTCFGDPNKQYVLGLPDIQGEIGGVWNELTSPDFLRIALGDVPVMLELIPSTLTPTHMFKGLAYLDAGLECAADGAVTINGSFVAAGPWTLEPAAAGVLAGRRAEPLVELPE
jgi:hypothetical protein